MIKPKTAIDAIISDETIALKLQLLRQIQDFNRAYHNIMQFGAGATPKLKRSVLKLLQRYADKAITTLTALNAVKDNQR